MKQCVIDKIESHLYKACVKHPDFGVRLPKQTVLAAEASLHICRENLVRKTSLGLVAPDDLLACEMAEVWGAYAKGDIDNAIDEIYDAIAVLMRLVARLEAEKKKKKKKEVTK